MHVIILPVAVTTDDSVMINVTKAVINPILMSQSNQMQINCE